MNDKPRLHDPLPKDLPPDSLPDKGMPDDPGDLKPPPSDDLPPAAGSIDDPLDPGETQPGEGMEQAQNLGGPVDIFPTGRGGRRREEAEEAEDQAPRNPL